MDNNPTPPQEPNEKDVTFTPESVRDIKTPPPAATVRSATDAASVQPDAPQVTPTVAPVPPAAAAPGTPPPPSSAPVAPAPAPAKQGFFAKLFHSKKKSV